MGDVTEDLAVRFGDVIGGLLNATFGNVVEMIMAVVALKKDMLTIVSTSLLGSVLSNLLLVLGKKYSCWVLITCSRTQLLLLFAVIYNRR